MKKILTVLILLCLPLASIFGQSTADRILGIYEVIGQQTGEKSKVEFTKKGDVYEAHIIWLENPFDEDGGPLLDKMNPDPVLAQQRVDKTCVLWDLKYDADENKWAGGKVYDPLTGKTYDAFAEFDGPVKLKVRGFVKKPVLGKTNIWTKIK